MLQLYCVFVCTLSCQVQVIWKQGGQLFLEILPTDSARWVGAIFQDLVSVVVGLDALVLGSNNETCF